MSSAAPQVTVRCTHVSYSNIITIIIIINIQSRVSISTVADRGRYLEHFACGSFGTRLSCSRVGSRDTWGASVVCKVLCTCVLPNALDRYDDIPPDIAALWWNTSSSQLRRTHVVRVSLRALWDWYLWGSNTIFLNCPGKHFLVWSLIFFFSIHCELVKFIHFKGDIQWRNQRRSIGGCNPPFPRKVRRILCFYLLLCNICPILRSPPMRTFLLSPSPPRK